MLLHGAGAASCLLYVQLSRFDAFNGAAPVAWFLALMAALFGLYALAGRTIGSWPAVFGWAILFRVLLIPAGLPPTATWPEKAALISQDLRGEAVVYERFLLYDNDLWRYLWDGHTAANGGNPYREAPASVERGEGVWAEVHDNISYAHIPTLYPPLAQWAFLLSHWLAPASVVTLKMLVILFDLGAGAFLALTLRALGRHPGESLLYLWNPLTVKVFAGSAHIDSLAVFALAVLGYCVARKFHLAAGVAFGLAVLAKLSPLVLIGLLARRVSPQGLAVGLGVVVAGYLPYLSSGMAIFDGARMFASFWEFNAGVLQFVRWIAPGWNARLVCAGVLGVLLLRIWRRKGEFFASAADSLGWLVVLSPAVMPWYSTWALPFAVLGRRPLWLVFSALVLASFGVMVDGRERPWILAVEFGLFFLAAWQLRDRREGMPGTMNLFEFHAFSGSIMLQAESWIKSFLCRWPSLRKLD